MRIWIAFFLIGVSPAIASTITKADIIKTVEHQRQLVHQAQADAAIAKQELVVVQDAINSQTAKLHETEASLDIARKELSDVRHRFHILLTLFSCLVGLLAFSIVQRFSSILLAFYPPALAFDWAISITVGIVAGGASSWLLGHL
jgi:hypothetical protein